MWDEMSGLDPLRGAIENKNRSNRTRGPLVLSEWFGSDGMERKERGTDG